MELKDIRSGIMTDNIQVTFAADGLLTGKMVLAHGTHQTDGYQGCGQAPVSSNHLLGGGVV